MATFNQIKQKSQQKGYSVPLVGFFAFITVLLFSYGCMKEETFSNIPQITFISHTLVKTTDQLGNKVWNGTIMFEFKDGDGNFGLDTPDSTTLPAYRYNLFLTRFEKKNGAFVEVPDSILPAPLSYTIPIVEPNGNNKRQKGTVTVVIQYLVQPADTIKYSFYIKDRDLNISNTTVTGEIIFNPVQK